MNELSGVVPEGAELGYHFCFGTWGGWPKSYAPDIGICVRLANEAVARAGRRVDYVPDADDAFFMPLRDLDIGETKAYMGIVLDDGLDAFERRARAIRRTCPNSVSPPTAAGAARIRQISQGSSRTFERAHPG